MKQLPLTAIYSLDAERGSDPILERAKEVLQRELKINEQEAYLTLQRESQQRHKSVKEVAEAILLTEELKHVK